MGAISSTYTDPSDTFVWWIEGDRIAIATTEGDGTTTETSEGDLKAVQLGSSNFITDGIIISYKGDPDRIDAITDTLDLDNSLQPLLIDYVKGHALLDAAAKDANPATAQIKMALAQTFLNNYKEGLRKFGMKKVDKIGGTRAVVPANLV